MIKYLKINWKKKAIEISEKKSFDSVEYDTVKAVNKDYIKEILRKALAIYERGKPITVNYIGERQQRKPIERFNNEPARDYTSKQLTGIIIRNERARKEIEILKLKIKE